MSAAATDPLAPLVALPGVRDMVGQTRAAVDRLLNNRTARRRSPDLSAESAVRGAWSSAQLAGSTASLDEVRTGAAAADPIVQGALRVQAALASLTDTWTHAPRQALARLHALAAADLVEDPDLLGRPAGAEVAARMDTLAAVLAATSAPALVVAAVVHGELLSLDAFPPASGLVARAAVRLTLIERGLDPKSLVVVETGHRELAAEYLDACAGYRAGGADGIAGWIVHCGQAVLAGTQEALAICAAMERG